LKKRDASVDCRDLKPGSREALQTLARLLDIGTEGLRRASGEGVLWFFDHPTNGRCWSVLDVSIEHSDSNLCSSGNASRRGPSWVRQDRRLDGKPFVFVDGSTAKGRTVGSPSYPVASFPLRDFVILCEGSSDFLAAHYLADLEGVSDWVSIVSMMGAGMRISEDRLSEFSGRRVLAFPDYDRAGISGMIQWERQLAGVVPSFSVFDYAGLLRDDSIPIKDLRDLVHINEDFEMYAEVCFPLSHLLSAKRMEVCHA
jgi:hypothetical protein